MAGTMSKCEVIPVYNPPDLNLPVIPKLDLSHLAGSFARVGEQMREMHTAFERAAATLANVRAQMEDRRIARELGAHTDEEYRALKAFVIDGGDPLEIEAIEEFFEVQS